ncbi:MAG TPA: hypothetical protein PLE16_05385 [Spirochaetota bacterium]|jgi:hypothetical protein|nr:hypothetical protein [Spirochaetota bacterium]HOH36279.1 hypothetical protein [Spirochaetota bacterium]HPJ13940.1 hypothetical protein [Spirochaetota bacterium]HPM34013.1 hypothetical protein [Spirochaetota bacterium]HPY02325.1 hypothetical protein [Spirochaetota bacterium]
MDMIRTTVNIDDISMNLLKKAALTKKKRESEMINIIVGNVVRRCLLNREKFVEGAVKYQEQKNNYAVYHYSVSRDIYESCLDLRKIYKMSVSRIINEAIKEIVGAMLRELEFDSHDVSFPSGNFFIFMDNYELQYTSILQFGLNHWEFSSKIRMRIT